MRILFKWRHFLLIVILINAITLFYIWAFMDSSNCQCGIEDIRKKFIDNNNKAVKETALFNDIKSKKLSDFVTFVMFDFELFDNDVIDTLKSILKLNHNFKILILTPKVLYPPLNSNILKFPNVRIVRTNPTLLGKSNSFDVSELVKTKYVILIPDAVRFTSLDQIALMMKYQTMLPNYIVAMPLEEQVVKCLTADIDLKQWTVVYKESTQSCSYLDSKVTLFLDKNILANIFYPFLKPFPSGILFQTSAKGYKVHVIQDGTLAEGKLLLLDPHKQWKHQLFMSHSKTQMYKDFGIKKVILPTKNVEWYGCDKTSQRCFGTVVHDVPEYLFENRWTPPCCLKNLRNTARYVFSVLDKCDVRYWLEGGSLLGAARNGDIIPWDYDVDIGMYKEDIEKCKWLTRALNQTVVDDKGFVWEKAVEGDFLRVQFSQSNHLHVDIFPFYSKNGIMTKDSWFPSHKQDTEFPEHFLRPLTKIPFIGIDTWAPNNVKAFLQLKFGPGAIENPQYPNPELLNLTNVELLH